MAAGGKILWQLLQNKKSNYFLLKKVRDPRSGMLRLMILGGSQFFSSVFSSIGLSSSGHHTQLL